MERDSRFKRRVETIRKQRKRGSKDPGGADKTSSETKRPTIRTAMYTVGSSFCSIDDSFLRDSFLPQMRMCVTLATDLLTSSQPLRMHVSKVVVATSKSKDSVQSLSKLNQSTIGIVKSL